MPVWLNNGLIVMENGVVCIDPDCPCPAGGGDDPSEFECFCCEDGDTGRTPSFWTVEIPNGTNNGCTDCGSMAATYELSQGCCGQSAADRSCDYELDGTGADCGLDYLILNIICGESNQIQVQIGPDSSSSADGGWLYEDFEAELVCAGSYDLDEESFLGTGTQCDWTGTTTTVTSSIGA